MNRAEIEIAVLQEAIQNINNIKNALSFQIMEPLEQLLIHRGIILAIHELKNMIEKTEATND